MNHTSLWNKGSQETTLVWLDTHAHLTHSSFHVCVQPESKAYSGSMTVLHLLLVQNSVPFFTSFNHEGHTWDEQAAGQSGWR